MLDNYEEIIESLEEKKKEGQSTVMIEIDRLVGLMKLVDAYSIATEKQAAIINVQGAMIAALENDN